MNPTIQAERGHYVFLRAGKLGLLIPQNDVSAMERLEEKPTPSGMPGLFTMPGKEEACYAAVSEELQLLKAIPDDRFVTTQTRSEDGMEIHWCWTEARILIDFLPQIQQIPEILLQSFSPLRQYVIMADQPVYLCSAQVLQELVLGAEV